MQRSLVFLCIVLLAGCDATPQPSATLTQPSPSTTGLIRRLQNNWHRCLEKSYQVASQQTPDKNAAGEIAFQSCASEEQELKLASFVAEPYSSMGFAHLKTETKHVLIEEGHLPIYPEQ
jgi:hypothetical protein